jgi:hypothetical protein
VDQRKALSILTWALIALVIVLIIDLIVILVLGIWNPFQMLMTLSIITFFESGLLLTIGGVALIIGEFPSVGKAINQEWTPEKGKETRELSYSPLLLAGFLFLVSIVFSLFVY